jgi:nucleolar protein 56
MSEVNHLLYEAPMGYAIFKVLQQGDIVSLKTAEGQQNATNLATFGKMIQLETLYVFQ